MPATKGCNPLAPEGGQSNQAGAVAAGAGAAAAAVELPADLPVADPAEMPARPIPLALEADPPADVERPGLIVRVLAGLD